jgi:hypothetical protein
MALHAKIDAIDTGLTTAERYDSPFHGLGIGASKVL